MDTVPSLLVSLLICIATLLVGAVLKCTVKVAVPPASEVFQEIVLTEKPGVDSTVLLTLTAAVSRRVE